MRCDATRSAYPRAADAHATSSSEANGSGSRSSRPSPSTATTLQPRADDAALAPLPGHQRRPGDDGGRRPPPLPPAPARGADPVDDQDRELGAADPLRRHPAARAPTRSGSTPTTSSPTARAARSFATGSATRSPTGPWERSRTASSSAATSSGSSTTGRRPSPGWSQGRRAGSRVDFPDAPPSPLFCLLAASLILAGCGSSDGSGGSSDARSRPAPPKSDFPRAKATRWPKCWKTRPPRSWSSPPPRRSSTRARTAFRSASSAQTESRRPTAEVALYFTKAPKNDQSAKALDTPAEGPFPARIESIATESAFRSQTTSSEAGAADRRLRQPLRLLRRRRVAGRGADPGRGQADRDAASEHRSRHEDRIPQVGQKAPLIHTPTAADVGGDLSKITTRIPPDTQNKVDYADVSARNRSCSSSRPPSSARAGSAARWSTSPSRSNRNTKAMPPSSTWRSTKTTNRRRSGPSCKTFHLRNGALAVRDRQQGNRRRRRRGSLRPRRNDPGAGEGDRGKGP